MVTSAQCRPHRWQEDSRSAPIEKCHFAALLLRTPFENRTPETGLPGWAERIRTRKCHAQTAPLKCRRNLAPFSEHLVTRDFSRESCQPLTRHCQLRCVPGT